MTVSRPRPPSAAPLSAKLLRVAGVLVLMLLVLAQAAVGQRGPSIGGRVVDETTGRAVSGARVVAVTLGGAEHEATAAADGTFRIDGLDGVVRLTVTHLGFETTTATHDGRDALIVRLRPSPLELDQVTVAATRAEKRLDDTPGSVSVVSRVALETRNIRRIDNALVYSPGVYNHRDNVLDDGHGSLHLRGIPSQKRTMVMLDGVPVNDGYNGNVRYAGFAPEELERVEVVRGPSSSLYGGYAMGGVINFVTRMPEGRTVRAEAGYAPDVGSNDNTLSRQRKLFVSAGDRIGRLSLLGTYRIHATDGYVWDEIAKTGREGEGSTPVTGFRIDQNRTGQTVYVLGDAGQRSVEDGVIGLKAAYDAADVARFTLSLTRARQEHDHGTPNTYVLDATGAPVFAGQLGVLDGGPRNVTLNSGDFLSSFGGKTHGFYSGTVETGLLGATSRLALAYNDYTSWYSTYDAAATYEGGPGRVVRNPAPSFVADLQSSFALSARNTFTVGGTFKRDAADLTERNLSNWRDTTTAADMRYEAGGKVTTLAAFVQDELRLHDALTLFLGLRLDTWRTHDGYADDVGKPDYPKSFETRSSSFVSPRIALIARPAEQTQVKLSAGRGFRGATVFELYRTWTLSTGSVNYSNPDLGPETVFSLDGGVQQRFGGLVAGVTLFRNDLRDLIHRMTLPNDDGIYTNTGRVVTQGVELQAEQRLAAGARLFANYTYTDAKIRENETAPDTEGKILTGVPEHLFNAGFEAMRGPWTAGLHGRHVSKRFSTDTNVDTVEGVFGSSDAYFLVNLRAAYRWNVFQASAALDNALDRRYYDYNLAPGRTLLLTVGMDLH